MRHHQGVAHGHNLVPPSPKHLVPRSLDYFHGQHVEVFHHLHDFALAMTLGMAAGFLLFLYLRLSRLRFTWALLDE